jgi:hypothetical protein
MSQVRESLTMLASAAAGAPGYEKEFNGEFRGQERRRGLWSFLTWAFVLSEVFGHDPAYATGIHAVADDEARPLHHYDDTPPNADDWPAGPLNGSDDNPGAPGETAANDHSNPVFTLPQGAELPGGMIGVSPLVPGKDVAGGGSSEGGGVTETSHEVSSGVHADAAVADASAISLTVDDMSGNPLLDLRIDIGNPDGLSNLVHEIGGSLAGIPVVGDLLSGLGSSVISLVEDPTGLSSTFAEPAVDVEQGREATLSAGTGFEGALASGGQLSFSASPAPIGLDDLFAHGRYTDYGVAMQSGPSHGNAGIIGEALEVSHDIIDSPIMVHTADPHTFVSTPHDAGYGVEDLVRPLSDALG